MTFGIGSIDMQHRINHLTVLIRSLLPGSSDASAVNERLQLLLEGDSEEEETVTLSVSRLRRMAISADNHDHVWSQGIVTPYQYNVGDLGYVPEGKSFESFVVLCNVITDGKLSLGLDHLATGWQSTWVNGFINRQRLDSFLYPPNISG